MVRKTKSGARLRQQNMRQNISAEAEYQKFTTIAGIIMGAFFFALILLGW